MRRRQRCGTGSGTILVEAYDVTGGTDSRFINLSARNRVGTGADIMIAGFGISGTGKKQLLIRAVGATLAVGLWRLLSAARTPELR